MKKYRLLIVDDEALIREGLSVRIAYFGFPDLDVAEAASGPEALDMIRAGRVDIALVDIAMPGMDGLEMVAKAREMDARTRFLLLSGFAEFAYAQKAITLGVRAYLNKPVSNEVLKKNIEDILDELRQEDAESPLHPPSGDQERELNILLSGGRWAPHPEDVYPALAEACPALFTGEGWAYLGILHISAAGKGSAEHLTPERLNALREAVRVLFAEAAGKEDMIAACDAQPQRLYCVLPGPDRAWLRARMSEIYAQVRNSFEDRYDARITLGVSRPFRRLSAECAADAQTALRQRRIHGRSSAYFFEDLSGAESEPLPEAELETLRKNMARGDRAGIRRVLENLFSEERMEGRQAVYLHALWVRVAGLVMGVFHGMDAATMNRLLTQISQVENLTDRTEMLRTLNELIDLCQRQGPGREMPTVSKIEYAIEYIREHYNEDIVINDLAARLDMSPGYFSSLFKKETGQSTMQYITGLRMERAQDSLLHTGLSVAAIAKNVGYEDSQYFFRVFKKVTGMTPLQYRQLRGQ